MGAVQLWQYVLCATGNTVSCQQSLMMMFKPSWTEALKYGLAIRLQWASDYFF